MDNEKKQNLEKINLELDFNEKVQQFNLNVATIKQKVDFLLSKLKFNVSGDIQVARNFIEELNVSLTNFIENHFNDYENDSSYIESLLLILRK